MLSLRFGAGAVRSRNHTTLGLRLYQYQYDAAFCGSGSSTLYNSLSLPKMFVGLKSTGLNRLNLLKIHILKAPCSSIYL
jgi:hypothetical protein